VDLLKVDVEGAEPLVFRGAKETLARNPQLAILMEWSPGQLMDAGFEPAQFAAELGELGLHPYSLHTNGTTAPLSWDQLAQSDYGNIVLRTRRL
jgi:hypothetical protein